MQPVWDAEIELTKDEQKATGRKVGAWCISVLPGFLSGHPPAIKMRGLPEDSEVWGNQYGKRDVDPNSLTQVLLTDQPTPFLKITNFTDSRAKVFGAAGAVGGKVTSGVVPPFFRVRGAMKPIPLDGLDVLNNIIAGGGDEFLIRLIGGNAPTPVAPQTPDDLIPEGNRLLYRCDVVLQVDKPTVKQVFAYDDIGLLRYNGFDIQLPQHEEYSARMYSVGIYIPPPEPTYWDIIFGTYIEIPYDEIVIGTCWFLSQVHRDNDIVDGTWLAFPQSQVFWNLNYSSIIQIDPFQQDRSLEWFKAILGVLAGGAGYLLAVSIVNPLEASYDVVNTAFNETAVRGQFWTG